jgi:hypothetical protein
MKRRTFSGQNTKQQPMEKQKMTMSNLTIKSNIARFLYLKYYHPTTGGLTPELTGRVFNAITGELTMKCMLTRAPVQ